MFPLFRKRRVWLPTWQAWLIAAILLGLATWFLLANLMPFLNVTEPAKDAKVLVIEGWIPDFILAETLGDFRPGEPYDYVCLTGGPLHRGSYLIGYSTFAELTANTVVKLGVPKEMIVVAPSGSHTRDRTYQSALAFKNKRAASSDPALREAGAIDVLTQGVHGRRTRMVFRKALGPTVEVGILSPDAGSFDPDRWFASSEGVKSVIIECVALCYEWFGKKER